MTSRLKRKLADLGVDASSSKANESFCLIGTPLPPLEKSKDTGEFVPLWKQEVRDEKGRRRLHGAFTGGFSAGYFNTVGSKEGWTPSTFVSSRSNRVKSKQARPEDFMDDEDLAELAESRKLVDTTEELDLTAGTRAGATEDDDSESMARKLENALLPPPTDSVGARILKKMGWRIGQGIGPRLTYRQKCLQDAALGTAGEEASMDVDEGGEESKHTYAPRDTPLLLPSRKTDSHGLGYDSGMNLYQSIGSRTSEASNEPRISAGFGLGALNEADDDDVDIYDSGPNRGKTRLAYDMTDQDDREDIIMGGRSSRRGVGLGRESSKSAQVSAGSSFRDGRAVLNGFAIASQPVAEDKWYPLPEVPKGWKPDPRRVWGKDNDKENVATVPLPTSSTKSYQDWKKGVSADERGAVLGETPLPAAPRSVFEYMSQKDRERLQRATASMSGGSSSTGSPVTSAPASSTMPQPSSPESIRVPRTEPYIAKAALLGFQPFVNDPVRQERYTTYLNSQSHVDGSYPALRPYPGQSIEHFNKEVSDFAKAAAVFKPLSGAMAGRFTSAATVELGPVAQEGLYQPTFKEGEDEAPKEEKKIEEKVDQDPRANAARLGMYGPMTRTVSKWVPARLLCKRFGVKDPHLEADPEEDAPGPQASNAAPSAPIAAITLPETQTSDEVPSYPEGSDIKKPSRPRDLSNIGLGEDEYQAQDVLTYQRPSMDVFKAIFASDDEDSDDENSDTTGKPAPIGPLPTPNPTADTPAALINDSLTSSSSDARQVANSTPDPVSEPGPVDLSTFKPTFVSRADREGRKDDPSKTKERKKKEKTLVSFDADDGEDSGLGAPKPKKRKDKDKHKGKDREKKRKKAMTEEDEDDVWVEKPPPEAVKNMATTPDEVKRASELTKTRGRPTAADFM